MSEYKLGVVEAKFAEIIWAHSPVSTRKLTEICEEEFGILNADMREKQFKAQ